MASLSLAAKLTYLLRRRRGPDGELPSNHLLSREFRALPGFKRGGSVGQLSNLRSGTDDNPTVATVQALATILDTPSPFLLHGWDDIDVLSLVEQDPGVREVVRHLEGLPPSEMVAVLDYVRKRRVMSGLAPKVAPVRIAEEVDSGDTGRHRRRRTASSSRRPSPPTHPSASTCSCTSATSS
ncbi:hypothetical protein ACWEQL_00450 [Kitasatospora sp. NPDC004240]